MVDVGPCDETSVTSKDQTNSLLPTVRPIKENDLLACTTNLLGDSKRITISGSHPSSIHCEFLRNPSPFVHSRYEHACHPGRASLQEAESPNGFRWTGHLSFWNWKTREKKERMTTMTSLSIIRPLLLHSRNASTQK